MKKDRYRELFERSADAILIIVGDKFVNCNASAVEMLRYKNKQELLNTHPSLLSPEHQPDGRLSYEKANEMISIAFERGSHRFEWEHKKADGTLFPVEVLLTTVTETNQNTLHVVWRDITDRKQAEKELRDSEKKYRRLVENLQDEYFFYSHDIEGNFHYLSPSLTMILGYTHEEFLTHYTEYLTNNPLNEKVREYTKLSCKGKQQPPYEVELYHKNKSIRRIEVHEVPIFNDQGKVIAVEGIAHDITERKLAEKAIWQSEERYRKLFADAPNCIMTISGADYTIQDFNQKALEMFRCEAKDLSGKQPHTLSPPRQSDGKDSIEKGLELFPIVEHQQGPLTFEWLHQRFDGEVFDSEVSISTLEHEPELTFQAIIRDISGRKKLDQEIRLLNHWIEHSVDFFFWVGEDSQILYVNQAVCDALGYSLEEMRTLKVGDFDLEITRDAWSGFTKKLREQGALLFESQLQKKDGEIFPVEITANILEFEGTGHYFAYGRDISASKKAETDRKTLEEQLAQAQKMEAVGTLAGGIAHDFNNILSPIMLNTEMTLEALSEDSPQRDNLEEVLAASNRAKDLVRQILTFSRQGKEEKVPLLLSGLVKEVLKLLRSTVPTTIDIHQRLEVTADWVLANPVQIHQVLMNLCTNAVHSMRAKRGILEISLNQVSLDLETLAFQPQVTPGNYLKLTVRDTGHGIPAQVIDQVFDPFFTTKERGEGTGLGLSVVQGIVSSHGGVITLESEPERGTSFFVYLPLLIKENVLEKEIDHKTTILQENSASILAVDDEAALVKSMKTTLEKVGYSVVSHTSSLEALTMFTSNPHQFDLVITDQTMPKMTGAELAENILNIRPEIPIILCTGFSEVVDEKKAKRIGIRKYMMKPVMKAQLIEAIAELLAIK